MVATKKRALLECGCGCGDGCLTGCCIPVDHSNPLYEPLGTPKNVPFTIHAPGCPEIDGYTDEMACGGTATAVPGPCGICVSCIGGFSQFLSGKIWTEFPPPMGCVLDTCSIRICLSLTCENLDTPEAALSECCSRFKLLVGSSVPIVGWDPDLNYIIGGCEYWKKVAPSSCVCNEDPAGFPAVTFPLSIAVLCTDFCGGDSSKLNCCDFATCSFSGATVVI